METFALAQLARDEAKESRRQGGDNSDQNGIAHPSNQPVSSDVNGDEAKETSDGRVLSDSGVIAGVDDIRDSRIGETMKIAPVATSVSAPDEAELEKQWIADGSTNSFKTWLIRKVAELQGWKESQMACTPDYQEIGKLLDVRWGESVHDKIVPGICALRDSRDRLQEALRGLAKIPTIMANSYVLKIVEAALGDPPERGGRND